MKRLVTDWRALAAGLMLAAAAPWAVAQTAPAAAAAPTTALRMKSLTVYLFPCSPAPSLICTRSARSGAASTSMLR